MTYDGPPGGGPIRQGELLSAVWEHHALFPPKPIPASMGVAVQSVPHDLTVVLSPDCDLTWDYEMRFVTFLGETPVADLDQHSSAVSHVLLCELQTHDLCRPRFKGSSKEWRRVEQNQDERYHHLSPAPVAGTNLVLHDLYMDFKRVIAVRTGQLYEGILGGHTERVAMLPPYYLHDAIQRFYGFLSRVALPQ
jgi:hypothetical protein